MDDLGVAVTLLVSSGVTRAAPSRVESLTPPPSARDGQGEGRIVMVEGDR